MQNQNILQDNMQGVDLNTKFDNETIIENIEQNTETHFTEEINQAEATQDESFDDFDMDFDEFEDIDFEAEFQKAHPYDSCSVNVSQYDDKWYHYITYGIIGILFGILFIKAEIISWFRIQEMFRLESFHMYGVIGSAVMVGIISVFIIKKFKIKTIQNEEVIFQAKRFNKGQIYGGLLFGLGWGITGACPGPLFAQIGTGISVVIVTLLSAILGTWIYGSVIEKLPR
jgi:uncharacterized protein